MQRRGGPYAQRINRKGLEVATKLADLKAGQNITLADMQTPGFDTEAMDAEGRVRAYLDLINAARVRLNGADYGRCLPVTRPSTRPRWTRPLG